MLLASSGASLSQDPAAAARELARAVGAGLGRTRASAAVFFATSALGPAFGRFEIALRAATGAAHVVGCSASATVAGEAPGEGGPGVSALALAGDVEARGFFVPSLRGRAWEVGREIGREVRAVERAPRCILLLADTYNLAPDELLAGIASVAPDAVVIGAGAAEDGTARETRVAGRGRCEANAVAGLVLGGVAVRSAVATSCAIHGRWRTITAASGNRILRIDDRPALPELLGSLPGSLGADPELALRSTLAALAPGGLDGLPAGVGPAWLARPFVGADEASGALLVGDEVVPGMGLAVAFRDPGTARRSLEASLEAIAGPGAAPPAGALYLACAGRGSELHGIPDVESAWLRRYLGDLPLAGAFCATGFAPVDGRNRFHQHAGIVVGLGEA